MSLAGRALLMSGGSRGIGLAIAVAAGRRGANVVLLAKTDAPDPRLTGTIHTAAAQIEAAGGSALAVVGDVRDETSVEQAVSRGVDRFGGSTSSSTTPPRWRSTGPRRCRWSGWTR